MAKISGVWTFVLRSNDTNTLVTNIKQSVNFRSAGKSYDAIETIYLSDGSFAIRYWSDSTHTVAYSTGLYTDNGGWKSAYDEISIDREQEVSDVFYNFMLVFAVCADSTNMYRIKQSTLTDIGNAVRQMTGSTAPIKVNKLAAAVRGIPVSDPTTLDYIHFVLRIGDALHRETIFGSNPYIPSSVYITPSPANKFEVETDEDGATEYVRAVNNGVGILVVNYYKNEVDESNGHWSSAVINVAVVPDSAFVSKDANLKPENIKNGITIYGVTGTYVGNSSGTEAYVEGTALIINNVEGVAT